MRLADRLALAPPVGLSVVTLVTTSAIFAGTWHPQVLWAFLAGASVARILLDLCRSGVGTRGDEPRHRAAWKRLALARFRSAAIPDVLPVAAVVLWATGVARIDTSSMVDHGLVSVLPVTYLAALALLVASFVWQLSRPVPSVVRLGIHVGILVLLLHATVPLVFAEPRYSWVYKHFGVVNYLNLHGSLDPSIDIYQNWPGFFALTAWFTSVGGASSPVSYAAWAQAAFNLLFVLELGLVLRALRIPTATRWLATFLFVSANWVAQDYFAPQPFAFLLALAMYGLLLQHLGPPWAWIVWLRRSRIRRPRPPVAPEPAAFSGRRASPVPLLVLLFVAMSVSHPLSPFLVLLSVGVLGITGVTRPRWLPLALGGVAAAYLAVRFDYVTSHYDVLGPIGRVWSNSRGASAAHGETTAGVAFAARAARALGAGLALLALAGVVRRLRRGEPTLLLALLAGVPVLLLIAQSYGGEVIYRIYLFSLPWGAVLAAAALVSEGSWSWRRAIGVGVALCVTLALFLPAYFGLDHVNEMRPGEVAASEYFYDRAPGGSVLVLAAPNFPVRVGGRYDEFKIPWGVHDPNLMDAHRQGFRHRMLGEGDLPDIESVVRTYQRSSGGRGFLAISKSQEVYTRAYGVLPDGSLASLDRALAASPDWRVFYRNEDAAIYELVGR
jgi:hypothetical protein